MLACTCRTLAYVLVIFHLSLIVPYYFIGSDALLHITSLGKYTGYDFSKNKDSMPVFSWDMTMFKTERVAFWTHIIFSPITLLCGLFQFSTWLRSNYPALHRLSGYLYLLCQIPGIPAGMYLGFNEYAGFVAKYGFIGMGMFTLTCSFMSYYAAAIDRDYEAHREWTIRSYFVMFGSVVAFRLMILFWIPMHLQLTESPMRKVPQDLFYEPYTVCIFVSWAIPLLLADIYLYFTRAKKHLQAKKQQ